MQTLTASCNPDPLPFSTPLQRHVLSLASVNKKDERHAGRRKVFQNGVQARPAREICGCGLQRQSCESEATASDGFLGEKRNRKRWRMWRAACGLRAEVCGLACTCIGLSRRVPESARLSADAVGGGTAGKKREMTVVSRPHVFAIEARTPVSVPAGVKTPVTACQGQPGRGCTAKHDTLLQATASSSFFSDSPVVAP